MVVRRQSAARHTLGALAAALALALPSASGAQCADEMARKVFEAGRAYYETGDYDEALRSFKRSFELCPKPEQLRNIGATHERLGNLPAAVDAYERYLKMGPDVEDREATRVRIANLRKRIEAAAPPESSDPPPPPSPAAPPRDKPRPGAGDAGPAIVVLSASGVVAVGALITGLLARSRFNEAKDTCAPSCSDGEVGPIRSMIWVSTALSGVALVGGGVGAYLLLGSSSTTKAGFRGLSPAVGPRQAQVGVRWAF